MLPEKGLTINADDWKLGYGGDRLQRGRIKLVLRRLCHGAQINGAGYGCALVPPRDFDGGAGESTTDPQPVPGCTSPLS